MKHIQLKSNKTFYGLLFSQRINHPLPGFGDLNPSPPLRKLVKFEIYLLWIIRFISSILVSFKNVIMDVVIVNIVIFIGPIFKFILIIKFCCYRPIQENKVWWFALCQNWIKLKNTLWGIHKWCHTNWFLSRRECCIFWPAFWVRKARNLQQNFVKNAFF